MVTTYQVFQVHSHSKSCRKYNNNRRYNFSKFFSNRTILAAPLPGGMSNDKKNIILQKRETTLSTAQEYINEKLDQIKVNRLDQRKADYKKLPSITDVTEDECYNALSISSDEYL